MNTYQPPLFRAIKLVGFGTVAAVMGETAFWEVAPHEVPGVGMFKEPTGEEQIIPAAPRAQGVEFTSEQPTFVYAPGQFPGLFETVRSGLPQTLRLSDGRRFLVGDIIRRFDGDTFKAIMQPITRPK